MAAIQSPHLIILDTSLLDAIQPGDTLMVTRLDRLARSTRDLLEITEPWVSGNGAGHAVRRQALPD
ncbi:recombinase family protein [Phytopseudomonas punonensis]|uniref:recombinase family protein n=1 Tax=Phytopseudomonas punonensis TaxID=1220495 RepID=UPI000933AD58|nr:recombinase family protein [Pseudomonas punonensis]